MRSLCTQAGSGRMLPAALVALVLAGGAIMVPVRAAAADEAPDAAAAELEARIEHARKQLDEAARELGELHGEMWRLETTGSRADRPMLGVLIDDSGDNERGLEIVGVSPGGGAEEAGLRAGDRLVMINGVRLDGGGGRKPLHVFSEAMRSVKAGEPVPVAYLRDGETLEAQVVTYPRGTYMARVVEQQGGWLEGVQALARLESLRALDQLGPLDELAMGTSGTVARVPAGLRLEDIAGDLAAYFDVKQGVLVVEAPAREPALKAGDILLSIDGAPAESADAALERLGKLKGPVPAQVQRRGRVHNLNLDGEALNARQMVQIMGSDRRIRIHRGDDERMEIVIDD